MRRCPLFAAGTAVVLAAVSCGLFDSRRAEYSIEDYWPLAVGNSWTIQHTQSFGTYGGLSVFRVKLRVIGVRNGWFEVESDLSQAFGVVDTFLARWQDHTFLTRDDKDTTLADDGDYFLKGPVAIGTRWCSSDRCKEIIATDTTVSTDAGTFQDVLVVRGGSEISTNTLYTWYAPNVGMVGGESIYTTTNRLDQRSELIAYTVK